MPKRILFISNSTVPIKDTGGGSVIVYRHLKRLKDAGFQILVIYISNRLTGTSKPVHEFEYFCIKKKRWYPPIRRATPFLTDIRISLTFHELNKKIKLNPGNDLVLGILGEVSNLLALKLKKKLAIPFYLFYHDDTIFNRYALDSLLTTRHIDEILNQADFVFPVSVQLTKLLNARKINQASTLYPIPEGYKGPVRKYRSTNNSSMQLLFAGMIEPIHFATLKKIGQAAANVQGRFYCVAELSASHQGQLQAGGYLTVKPRFPSTEALFNYITGNIDVLVVFYSFDIRHEPRMLTSFPSKFVEYCHLGLPIFILAPHQSALGQWAVDNSWLSYSPDDDPDSISGFLEKFKDKAFWENCQKQSLRFAQEDFNPKIIHQQFLKHLKI
jgi:glycosyltransferase involved in cell wall biosynthesis